LSTLAAKLENLDRRWIFLLVAVSVIVPFLYPMNLPVRPTKPVKQAFDAVEALAGTGKPLLLSYDFEPGGDAELGPVARALLTHAFARDIPVVVINFMPAGAGLAENDLKRTAAKFNKVYGKDYIFLGYNPSVLNALLLMGREVRDAFPTDSTGRVLDSYEIMKDVHSYDDFGLVVDISSSIQPEYFIRYAVTRFGAKLVLGATAVMASDFYPYLQAGQCKGLIGGMKGAAEYERLLLDNNMMARLGDGMRGMDSQSLAHAVIVLLIVLGNLSFFLGRWKRGGHHG